MSKTEKNKILFDSDNEEEVGFKTNEKYAKHYMEFRKKELLSHVKNLEEEETSSDDDASTDEELVNPEFDEEFFKTMAFLKNKDPTKYQQIPSFFENVQSVEDVVKGKQRKPDKIVTVADHQRERLIKTGGVMSDDEESNQVELSYAAEQEKIRNDLRKALNDSSGSDDESNLFKVREKTSEEATSEQVDYEKWLTSQSSKEIKPLKDFWTNNTLSKEDKFLRDYILKQRFISKGEDDTNDIVKDVIALSDDETEVEKQIEYEHKYNFRFEEPDDEFIKRFPRNIEESVRVEKSKRKEQRKEREERKAKEKELKMKELRELHSIRKREIEEKLLLLKDVAGNDNLHEILHEEDLNSDFDPSEHDKRMSKIFNDEYYGIDEGEQKPEFPDIDQELAIENWDNFDKNKSYDEEPHCEDDDFIMDCDYDPEQEKKQKLQNELIQLTKGRKRKKKISKLAELIKRDKPAYEPSDDKTYAEYLDEYYALDYEDIIGDQPCRFKYTECVPNDFGLSVDEILTASNKELNQWASLKKTMQNRPKNVELNDVEKYSRMKNNLDLKKKIFKSIYGEQVEESSESENESKVEATVEVKSSAKKKKKKKKSATVASQDVDKNDEKSSPKASDLVKNVQKVLAPPENSKEIESTLTDSKPESSSKAPETVKKVKKPKNPTKAPENSKKIVIKNDSKPGKFVKAPEKVKSSPKALTTPKSSQNKSKKRKLVSTPENSSQASKKIKTTKAQQEKPKSSVHIQNGANIVQFKQRGFNRSNQNTLGGNTVSDNRLKAFGINPKKFRSKMKYGGKNKK